MAYKYCCPVIGVHVSKFFLDFTVQQDLQINRDLEKISQRNNVYRQTASRDLAKTVGDFVRMAPGVQPHLVLPVAQAVQSGHLSEDAAQRLIMDVQKKVLTDPKTFTPQERPSGAWDWIDNSWDWTFDKLKGSVRWAWGGVSFFPELIENALSATTSTAINYAEGAAASGSYTKPLIPQIIPKTQQESYKSQIAQGAGRTFDFGVQLPSAEFDPYAQWRSTTLGTLISGPDVGRGWFIGEEAQKEMTRYQREVRGSVNGHAMTPGRGLALLVAQPDTVPYSIISGSIDAYLAAKIPAVPFSGELSNIARTGLSKIDVAALGLSNSDEAMPFLRSMAGLVDGSGRQIVRSRVAEFLDSAIGRFTQERIASIDSIEEARRMFPKADLQWWKEVVDATPDTVKTLLRDKLGITPGLMSTNQINLSRWSDVKNVIFQSDASRWSGLERLMSNRAGKEIWLVADNPRDLTRSVNNLIDYMIALRISPENRKDLINKLAVTLTDKPEDFRNVAKEITETVTKQIIERSKVFGRTRITEDLVRKLADVPEEIRDGWALFGMVGPDSHPFIFGLTDPKNALIGHTIEGVPGTYIIADDMAMLSTEHRRIGMMLPDPDRVYRATSPFNFIFEKGSIFGRNPQKFGDPRMLTVALDVIQNRVWRTLTLMTGGFALRNMSESAMRNMLSPGIKTGPLHPLEHIQAAIHGDYAKYMGDIEGALWHDAADPIQRKIYAEFLEATEGAMRESIGSDMLAKIAGQTGAWSLANSSMGSLYVQGIADNIHLLANDPLARLVAQGMPLGAVDQPDTILHWLSTTDEGQNYLKMLQARHYDKPALNTATGKYERIIVDWADKDNQPLAANIQKLVDEYLRPRIEFATGNHPELRRIIETGDMFGKFTRDGKEFTAFKTGAYDIKGNVVALDYDPEFLNLVNDAIKDPNYILPEFVKYRVHTDTILKNYPGREYIDKVVTRFFSGIFGKSEAFLNRSPAFRQFYYQQVANLIDELAPGEARNIALAVEAAHSLRFQEVVDRLTRMKPDADGMFNYGDELVSAAEHQRRLAEATSELANRKERFLDKNLLKFNWAWPEQYVGSKDLWKKIIDKANNVEPSKGTMTAAELNTAAKAYAMEETKALFYNAAERNNMAEVLRIVVPFGKAWAEVMKNWSNMVIRDPEAMRKAQITVRGIYNADPDADGRGFIYTDPISGEPVFNYPLSEYTIPVLLAAAGAVTGGALLTPLSIPVAAAVGGVAGLGAGIYAGQKVSDVNVNLTAPAKSLSMGFNVLPGIGPVAQLALDRIIPEKPKYDDIRKMILPFGAPQGPESVIPSWGQKFIQAFTADPNNDETFLSAYVETYSALLATGKYDNNSPEQMQALDKDAKGVARWLTVIRSLGQFVGPSRPNTTLEVPTKFKGELTVNDVKMMIDDGNIPNIVLGRVFRQLQDQDYQTAVPKFLDMFGYDLYMYTNGKSYALTEGISASKQFGDWERENTDVRERHPDVYGYFANVGTDFDQQTYIRQFATNDRARWTDPNKKRLDAEAVVGNALYRQYQRQLGPDVTPQERAALNKYQADLYKAYPGYAERTVDINKYPALVVKLEEASRDSALDGNQIAVAARAYFDFRNDVLTVANERRDVPVTNNILAGNKNSDLRQVLRQYGDTLAQQYPGFARMWDNVLFYEVDEG